MAIEQSGYYYPNRIARIIFEALEEIMGRNGFNAILNLADLSQYIDNYPPENLNREFDFAELSALMEALEQMYGPRGGRGLAQRAGRAAFAEGLRNFGALAGAGDLAFKILPLPAKVRIGLPAMAKIFTQLSDQISNVHEFDDHYIYTLERCPMCWGRKSDKPVCFMGKGLLEEGLRWVSGGHEFKVEMDNCIAKGDEMGRYVVRKNPID
jgi:predicted hydrocarbon binding protein